MLWEERERLRGENYLSASKLSTNFPKKVLKQNALWMKFVKSVLEKCMRKWYRRDSLLNIASRNERAAQMYGRKQNEMAEECGKYVPRERTYHLCFFCLCFPRLWPLPSVHFTVTLLYILPHISPLSVLPQGLKTHDFFFLNIQSAGKYDHERASRSLSFFCIKARQRLLYLSLFLACLRRQSGQC